MKELAMIESLKTSREVLKEEKWLKYLFLTKENHVNMEHLSSMDDLKLNHVLKYVERTLRVLEIINCEPKVKQIVKNVLLWSEVAKGGMPSERKHWMEKGYNIIVHNEGSASIYEEHHPKDFVTKILIETHGLIGQFIRGEVSLSENKSLTALVENDFLEKNELEEILIVLNQCILSGVSKELWENLKDEVKTICYYIANGKYEHEDTLKSRIKKLRKISINNGEDFERLFREHFSDEVKFALIKLFGSKQLWFVEPALYDFSFEEFTKIFLLIYQNQKENLNVFKHITLESFMNQIYYQYKGEKTVNIYKKRMIEKLLRDISVEQILDGDMPANKHVNPKINVEHGTLVFEFVFSSVGEKLIDFCLEAEKEDMLHEKAIVLLFDLFGFRRDEYDRFHNEDQYLKDMNASGDFKRVIVDTVVGKKVLDVGPGGGVMLDMVEETYPEKEVFGIDISDNVIDFLGKKKQTEKRKWEVVKGDALNLRNYFKPGSIDTIIYSSIIHELYSYIKGANGKRFKQETIETALKSAYEVLSVGGRIIIRDGIMTEPKHEKRIIEFKDPSGMEFLKRYCSDFEGRTINYGIVDENKVIMYVNDAMEFLYTYTWGEEAYAHEINEQFGYFTPSEYESFIHETLGESANIIESRHYLQDGYSEFLLPKVAIYNEKGQVVDLPDSTCFIVIEKN